MSNPELPRLQKLIPILTSAGASCIYLPEETYGWGETIVETEAQALLASEILGVWGFMREILKTKARYVINFRRPRVS